MAWTPDQLKAIELHGKNLLVSAAAGSGKTAVLVERIIRMILDGVCDIDRMLVVTFTNAAAAEMRSRIHSTLAQRMLDAHDDEYLDRLERQSILLSGASIMTVHAFCQMLLRRYFSKIDLDPKFRTADEHELNIFMQELIEEVFESRYADDDLERRERFQRFTDDFGGSEHGDAQLHELVLELYATAQSHVDPEGWLRALPTAFDIPSDADIKDVRWYDEAAQQIVFELDAAFDECMILQNFLGALNNPTINDDADFLCDLKRAFRISWESLHDMFHRRDFTRLKPMKGVDANVKQQVKTLRDGYKNRIKRLRANYFFSPPAQLIEDLRAVHSSIETLVDVTIDFADAFANAKRERCIIDFNDMEHLALKILSDQKLAAELSRRYRTVMIDEYQDTNAVQEAIMQSIVRDDNLFVVGDVKQSIYRFRLADPTLFMRKYDEYPTRDDCERIELSMNFRSRRTVIDAVNFVFERLMMRDAVEIDYTDDARLNCGADYPPFDQKTGRTLDSPTEFYLINGVRDSLDDHLDAREDQSVVPLAKTNADYAVGEAVRDHSQPSRIELETQLIADRIKKMFLANVHVFDKELKTYRPIEYRDIVVLLRTAARSTGAILDVLKKNNIPAYSAEEETYFRATEIQVIVSLLTILDNARQDIPMAAVLLSPIGKFSSNELAQLKIISPYDDLYTLLSTAAIDLDGSVYQLPRGLSRKAVEFLRNLNRWREQSMTMSVPELLSTIYRQTNYYEAVGAMRDGMQRQANLRMLIDRAAAYEQTSFRGLSRFLQFIKKIRELDNDLKSARTLGENENVVRIMTIHKSKGLEFPVVFVADLGHGFNIKDETATPLLTHRELGAGPYRMFDRMPVKIPTLARRVISTRGLNELIAEELRILYVAMTRAREKLILVASSNKDVVGKYSYLAGIERLKSFMVLDARSFLDWLQLALTRETPSIKFSTVEPDRIQIGTPSPTKKSPSELRAEQSERQSEQLDRPLDQPLDQSDRSLERSVTMINLPAKMSVTEIKRRFSDDDATVNVMLEPQAYRRPNFEQSTRLTGSEYGTAMHSVMQHLDLRGDLSSVGLNRQIGWMVDRKIISPEAARAINRRDALRFFDSEPGRRMLRAEKIYRELPFSVLVAPVDLNRYFDAERLPEVEDKIFVQGIIDVLFREGDRWIMLDYKTDRAAADEVIRQKYRLQIELYARAVESILGATVDEKFIFMLSTGSLLPM